MKKIIISALLLLATGTVAMAAVSMSDDRAVTIQQLPQKAQQFIKQYFATNTLSYAKQDTDMFDGDYEVMFTDGSKVEFTKKGEWKEVKCKLSEVPAGVVPAAIKTFISQKHPDQKVLKIDRDKRDYELKLTNGMELKFNLKGQFLGYDN